MSDNTDQRTGDERPCLRCIKRGLQSACHDGVRKKAKYLHDAPPDALAPGASAAYLANGKKESSGTDKDEVQDAESSDEMPDLLPPEAEAFPTFDHIKNDEPQSLISTKDFSSSYNPRHTPHIPQFDTSRQTMHNLSSNMGHMASSGNLTHEAFVPTLFDSHDPTLLDFDLPSMNFGNHYGALEFGMLGHMSSTAGPYAGSAHSASYLDGLDDQKDLFLQRKPSCEWQSRSSNAGLPMQPYPHQRGNGDVRRRSSMVQPPAYAIGAGPPSGNGVSPGMTGMDTHQNMHESNSYFSLDRSLLPPPPQASYHRNSIAQPSSSPHDHDLKPNEAISAKLSNMPATSTMPRSKTRRDPSEIYNSVTQPYPYTAGFHGLTAVIYKRFSSTNRLRIAQALAAIRPSFISCTRNLINADLVFMEKCFQRQLLEYQQFVTACGTPTIVCRRTGEVAHVGKEFSLLTGWSRDVLLGAAPNLNVNKHCDNGGSGTATVSSSRGGYNTPRTAEGTKLEPARPQPVFLAELLDDDSVIQFYEDFAKLAFADSKGSVWSPCKLLKYKTLDIDGVDNTATGTDAVTDSGTKAGRGDKKPTAKQRQRSTMVAGYGGGSKGLEPVISTEDGIRKLGDKDGKVDCVYCWMVRRDVFDIPMMIVINVSGPGTKTDGCR